MKRSQLNIVLLAVGLGLAAAVFFSQKKEEKGAPLTPVAADAVTKIVLEHPGKPAVKLQKDGVNWKLTEPVQADADAMEVAGIVSLAAQETKSTVDTAGVKLAELGLEPPEYKVTLNDQVIGFGGTEPLQFRRYLSAGGKVVLADDPPAASFDADYSELVAKNLLPPGADIQKIQLPKLAMARAADGKGWTLMPDDPKAGADRKQKLADAWKGARAMWNALEDETTAVKDAKAERVTITLKDRELSFIVAETDPQLVLVRPDLKVRFTLSKELVGELLQLPEDKKPEPAKPAAENPS